MGRDVGGHANSDPRASIDQQVRESAGQNSGLESPTVVVRGEVDGLLIDIPHHLHCQLGHPALGVALGCGRVVPWRTKVSLALHEWVPKTPRLRESDESVVDRTVSMRVVTAHYVADHSCALGEVTVRPISTVVHRVQNPAVHRLESVAHVGQRARHDDGHRVVQVRPLHLSLQINGLDARSLRWFAAGRRVDGVDVVGHLRLRHCRGRGKLLLVVVCHRL